MKQCTCDTDSFDIEKQESMEVSNGTQSSSSLSSASATSMTQKSSVDAKRATQNFDSKCEQANDQRYCEQRRWVLLCLPGQKCHELKHACMKAARCNKDMYAQLHRCYCSEFRPWIRWLTLQRLDSVSFVRVSDDA